MVSLDKRGRMKRLAGFLFFLVFFVIFVSLLFIGVSFAISSGGSGNANLTIYDSTDSNTRYTLCNSFCAQKNKPSSILWNIPFFANFTNSTGNIINASNGNGSCQISFNESGTFTLATNMDYNSSSLTFYFLNNFTYKGNLNFSVSCNSSFGDITLYDNILIENTDPYIIKTAGSIIDFDGDGIKNVLQCNEDILCIYNFTANVSEDDRNDVLLYNYTITINTTLTNFTLNTSNGILIINITSTAESGSKQIELSADDNSFGGVQYAILEVNITPVNDAPYFINFTTQNMNRSSLFNGDLNVYDEENNSPFALNISFVNCSVAQWSTRNCSDSAQKALFNSSGYSFNGTSGILNFNFTPSRNDVGSYVINFTLFDFYNATNSVLVTFNVLNINELPYFTYLCDDNRNTTENSQNTCYINVTDIDETSNLTLTSSISGAASQWFLFNDTGSNSQTKPVNITTGYNASFLIKFTPNDREVGNWTVNISATDTQGSRNSTTFNFFVGNVNDSLSLQNINLLSQHYTTSNYTYYLNASDDDLLIIDKSIFDESITFSSNASSWVTLTNLGAISNTNKSQVKINIYPNSSLIGTHFVNISASDISGNSASIILSINVSNNNAPVWNSTFALNTTYLLNESISFYLNLSGNVTDADNDALSFSYSINNIATTSFPSFVSGFSASTGVISLTPDDFDVGTHNLTINVTDIAGASASLNFIFIVYNRNDNVSIDRVGGPIKDTINSSADSLGNINMSEDDNVTFKIYIIDNDYNINDSMKASFYNETTTFNLTIQGANTNLFGLTFETIFPGTRNISVYKAQFMPNKSDTGNYTIILNVSDYSNASDLLVFNLTIFEIAHAPELNFSQSVNITKYDSLFFDLNASDLEDGDENTLNLTYRILNLTAGGDFISLTNSTFGIIVNNTSLLSKAGQWLFNVIVNDSSGMSDSQNLTLNIFDEPNITSPGLNIEFNTNENQTLVFNFTGNHAVADYLNYTILVNGVLKQNILSYGNGTESSLNISMNFTDETTCLSNGKGNITLIARNQNFSVERTWNITINHTNYPLSFFNSIGDVVYSPPLLIIVNAQNYTLSQYFADIDASDSCVNQTIGFVANLLNGTAADISIVNWSNTTAPIIRFSSASELRANYSITAFEYNSSYNSQIINNVTSNNFSIYIIVDETPTPSPAPSPSGGGGGGSNTLTEGAKPISLKIILPEPISANKVDKIVLPISLYNDGYFLLQSINLSSLITFNGTLIDGILASLDREYIDSLNPNQTEYVNLTIEIDTERTGIYEITINASVQNPKYEDWGKMYIDVMEKDNVGEKIVFTEELIASNPECAEIQEIVDEAREAYEKKDFQEAQRKADEAILACKKAIAQKSIPILKSVIEKLKIADYVLFASIISAVLGFGYYIYKRRKMRNMLSSYKENLYNEDEI